MIPLRAIAAKTFEERTLKNGSITEQGDFESVYHLVIDAVDSFNERWEDALKLQQQVSHIYCTTHTVLHCALGIGSSQTATDSTTGLGGALSPSKASGSGASNNTNIAVKRTMFMTGARKPDKTTF
jgi:hypothetical protein